MLINKKGLDHKVSRNSGDTMRTIIKIDAELCNGCAACVEACHEGAIDLIEGKARLLRDDYCDGLGDCLPACPTGAITLERRAAALYDEKAVKEVQENKVLPEAMSQLTQWPIQIKLMPVRAPYFNNADLLIAADCAAFAHADFHAQFIKDRVTIIGCPKLDSVDYGEKLRQIMCQNNINSVVVVRMQVPCCGGIEQSALRALQDIEEEIPLEIVTLSVEGRIL